MGILSGKIHKKNKKQQNLAKSLKKSIFLVFDFFCISNYIVQEIWKTTQKHHKSEQTIKK